MATYTETVVSPTTTAGSSYSDTTSAATETVASPSISANGSTLNNTITPGETPTPSSVVAGSATVNNTISPTDTVTVGGVTATGVIIPTGDFRDVTVWLEDESGEPLTDAEYVQATGVFPTAATVQTDAAGNTYAVLWLLYQAYDELLVLADSGQAGADYVWYQTATGNPDPAVEDTTREVTLSFKKEELGGGGLKAAGGVTFG